MIKKELLEGIPGTLLDDLCGSGKSIIVPGFLLAVRKLFMNRYLPKYTDFKQRIMEMDTGPTLLLCPASMVTGWISKFEENLEYDHPFNTRLYHNLQQSERPMKRDDVIFQREAPDGVLGSDWHNCRIVFAAWTRLSTISKYYKHDFRREVRDQSSLLVIKEGKSSSLRRSSNPSVSRR